MQNYKMLSVSVKLGMTPDLNATSDEAIHRVKNIDSISIVKNEAGQFIALIRRRRFITRIDFMFTIVLNPNIFVIFLLYLTIIL